MNNKKFLIVALSLILLFTISCGDRPTGSDSGVAKLPSSLEGKYYVEDKIQGSSYSWLHIKDGDIYEDSSEGNTFDKKPNFTEDKKVSNLQPERENVYKTIRNNGQMEFIYDFSDSSKATITVKQDGVTQQIQTFNLMNNT